MLIGLAIPAGVDAAEPRRLAIPPKESFELLSMGARRKRQSRLETNIRQENKQCA